MVEAGGRRFRVVEMEGELVAHSTVCPHRGGPLEDGIIEDGCIRCPWHGYRFDVCTGRNLDGHALELPRAPRLEIEGRSGEAYVSWV